MSITNRLLVGLILLLGASSVALAAVAIRDIEIDHPAMRLQLVHDGLGIPWGMAFVSPHQFLVTERQGQLRLVDLERQTSLILSGLPAIVSRGQGGLLDVATGPNFVNDAWVYFTYSKPVNTGATTTLARARIERDRLADWQDLLVTDAVTDSSHHFGSRIAFDDQGHVFFGVGDRGNRHLAQDNSNHAGSIIRLNLDGSIPDDNPFVGARDARAEIWSYGHRNPQGLLFDAKSQRLWSVEHGPRGGDEINLILKGRNYGWPVVSHGKEYWGPVAIGDGVSKPGIATPRKVYIPSIAPSSLLLYRGDAFPDWRNSLFIGALKLRHVNRVSMSGSGQLLAEERLLSDISVRVRNLIEAPNGWIYLATDSGLILRLRPE